MKGAQLQATLLGVPKVTWQGEPLAILRRQPRALLYRLAAELRPVARSQLCYLFWPDVPEWTARRNLTRLLVLLRGSLPDPTVLVVDEEAVALDRRRAWSDTVEFRQLARNAAAAQRRLQGEAYDKAAALYRGPFLDGFALPGCPEYETWQESERRAWERRLFDSLAVSIEAHTAASEYAAAIAAAHRYLQADEMAEDVHRRLITLYAATGDRAAAVRQYEQCAAILERNLGVAPLPETKAAVQAAQVRGKDWHKRRRYNQARHDQRMPAGPYAPPDRRDPEHVGLPAAANALIGRTVELHAVAELLRRPDARIVTLSGPGGAGKTRLALAAASAVAGEFADGAVFVPLAPLREAGHVVGAIMNALRLPDQGDQPPLSRLQAALRHRELLLILDNCEHVTEAAAEIASLPAAAPQLKVLATSRALLRITGEHTYHVPPLALADLTQLPHPVELARVEAVALFLARVRERLPSFALTAENAEDVAAICARLDGLPLAIELAAARAAMLSPRMLRARLDRRLAILTDGPRDLPERQRTLRATIEWSYRLLDLSEQLLFGRLAVFAGSWDLPAAEAVAGAVGALAASMLDGLQALVDKHLVLRLGGPDAAGGEPRFSMLETIREYALEQLAERGEEQKVQAAHAEHYLALAEAAAPQRHGPAQVDWLNRLDEEQANLRVAVRFFLDVRDAARALRLAEALHWYWHVRGHFGEGRAVVENALAAASSVQDASSAPAAVVDAVLQARAYAAASLLTLDQGDLAAARGYAEASTARWRILERDPQYAGEARRALILTIGRAFQVRTWQGDMTAMEELGTELFERYETVDDPWFEAFRAYNHGFARLHDAGEVDFAHEQLLKAQQLFAAVGDTWYQAQVLWGLGLTAYMAGDSDEARRWYETTLVEARRLQDRPLEALALDKLGEVARLTGADARAGEYYAASLQIYRELDSRLDIPRLLHNLGYLALHAGDISLARVRLRESLAGFRTIGHPRGQADVFAALAAVAAEERTEQACVLAARLWGQAAAVHRALGAPVWPSDQAEIDRYQAAAREAIGDAAFTAAYAAGASLGLDQAAAEALRV